ncbi:Transcription initiation factor TFIID subunit like [Actinidia chinensis var. chinensis]|uniref:Transcription initiation factor TFIID subunit 5 n=1 Tax=Actinidia chinensis var. chinensis TaxID=1590841 RepID=A0A2R6R4M1_ACTCC|nr:Transcription initiation factor TFIID subunit like [Actinidia chinensis var. chinensis]
MEEEEIEKAVIAYLKKKGFKQTELAFQEEQQQQHTKTSSSTDPDIAKHILSFSESENVPAQYHDGYSKLRSWTYSSLDQYKHELLRVLYPVFIHCFMDLVAKGHIQEARVFFNSFREDHEMMHLRDLQKLEGVLSPSHLEEMEFAHSLRQSKVNIKICQCNKRFFWSGVEMSISVQKLNGWMFAVQRRKEPGSISDDAEVVTLVGSGQDAANLINQREIHWGLLEDSLEERLEKTGSLLSDLEKVEGETKEGDLDESKKRAVEGGKQGGSLKKSKKDKVAGGTGKAACIEGNTVPAAPRVKPELTLPVMPTEIEHSILEDLRNRVQLSSVALPSVSFYTFVNTHNGLNCSSISYDGSLVAGGFSDSSLKLWDMAKLGQQTSSSILQGENDSAPSEHVLGTNGRKRSYTLFRGHSGPVYSASFSPFGDFLLSSSSDSTVRLWSTKLNANLVCYKGHNYPVWDVQFSPVGHYFASASHDRTARIWSMDRIQPLRIMAGHLSDVDCVQWHANCNYIATGSSDKTVRLWDVQSGECVRIFIGHRSMVLSLAMSPDGRYMASGDEDGTIMMWDLSSGRCVTPLVGHTSCVWTIAFSCEGSLLASGSADCTVKLWDVTASTKVPKAEEKTGSTSRLRSLKTLPTKSTPVYSLQFSRRNLLFAAGVLSKGV